MLFLGILCCHFLQLILFLHATFYCNFYLVWHKLLVRFKQHAIKLYQYSSIVFDLHYKELCGRLPASHCYLGRNSWFTTSCALEQSFSMLGKLLEKDRHFSPNNVCKCLALYVNKSLE